MNEVSTLAMMREVQIPLLAALLISGCAAKAWSVGKAHASGAGTEPTATFPLGSHRPAAIALCVVEFMVGTGLLLTAGRLGAGAPAFAARAAAALLLGTAAGALHVLRARRPDAGCGCFGEFSRAPVGWRVILRAALLSAAAVVTIGLPPLRMPASADQAWLTLAMTAVEVTALCLLSPETGQILLRLSHAEPCEIREVPVARTLSALRASPPWRQYRRYLVATTPLDVWREGCWRFVVYPAVLASRRVLVVFAVHVVGRGDRVRVGLLDTGRVPAAAGRPTGPLQLSKLI